MNLRADRVQPDSNEVTTPKLPPPPRSAQNRSGCETQLAGQPAGASAKGEPGDAGVVDEAPGDGEAVRLGGGVQVGQARPATDDRPPALGIHHHVPHPAQVDHQAALAHGRPRGTRAHHRGPRSPSSRAAQIRPP